MLATFGWDKSVCFWDTNTAKPIGPVLRNEQEFECITFSPDGKTLLTGHLLEAVFWDVASGRRVGRSLVHRKNVWVVAFSPDGKRVITGGKENTARIWDVESGRPVGAVMQHRSGVTRVAFSPDSKIVLTGGYDSVVRIWDSHTGRPIGPPLRHLFQVDDVAFGPDGRTFLTLADQCRIWQVPEMTDDVSRAAKWVEGGTGMELDEQGSARLLDGPEWHRRRALLESSGGEPEFRSEPLRDPLLYGHDPLERARSLIDRKLGQQAENALDEVVAAWPAVPSHWLERSRFHNEHGRPEKARRDLATAMAMSDNFGRAEIQKSLASWSQAAAEYDAALKRGFDDPDTYYQSAICHLLADELTAYRGVCAEALRRLSQSDAPAHADRITFACVSGADAVRDLSGLLQVAMKAIPARSGNERLAGAALYRAGRAAEAIEQFQKSQNVSRPRAWDWLFLAMIQSRLGHADDSRQTLARAREWIARANTQPTGVGSSQWNGTPTERPLIALLLAEAEAVILYDPIFPADPFAP